MMSRLKSLRASMLQKNLNAIIVPANDAHFSEYTDLCDNRRQWISNFSGSAGTAVITNNKACLWTDGRYFTQANLQLDLDHWTLMKEGELATPSREKFLQEELSSNDNVYLDGSLSSLSGYKYLKKQLNFKKINLITDPAINPLDEVWEATGDRPKRTNNPLLALDLKYSGKSWQNKVKEIREEKMKPLEISHCIFSSLDDIAWLFNLRGSDITCNPVFFSYCLLSQDKIYLYLQANSENDKLLKDHLGDDVIILPYETAISDILSKVDSKAVDQNNKIWMSEEVNFALAGNIPEENRIISTYSEISMRKQLKNSSEKQSMLAANVKASVAICKYLSWLEQNFDQDENGISEADGADKLTEFYSKGQNYQYQSFPSISSTNENGNILHYKPVKGQDKTIREGVYLIDSGAQYLDGTTDTTRTILLTKNHKSNNDTKDNLENFSIDNGQDNGASYQHIKNCYSRVLNGHLSISSMKFPQGTTGYQIDALARKSLWDVNLDYLHGTGHGIGCFLNVHEGPRSQYITSKCPSLNSDNGNVLVGHLSNLYLKPNLILSNEPGYYEAKGKFGIRIENAVIVNEENGTKNVPEANQGLFSRKFYGFEDLIYCPYSFDLTDESVLGSIELAHLKEYNKKCRDLLLPLLSGPDDVEVKNWVEYNTQIL